MDNRRNYYRILHVQFDAPDAVIRASYRTIMQKLRQHPDLGGDQWNATVINEAYAVLSNPARRAVYDKAYLAKRGEQGPVQSETKPSSSDNTGQEATAADAVDKAGNADAAGEAVRPETKTSETGGKSAHRPTEHCPFCGHRNVPTADECNRCWSPLTPAPEVSVTIDARRHIERIPVRARVTFYDHWPQRSPYTGEVRDLSPRGCQLITARPVPRGRRIKIDTPLFSAIGTIQASRGHTSESGMLYVLAIKFATLRFAQAEGSFVSVDA